MRRLLSLWVLVAHAALAQTLTKAPTLLEQVEPVFPAELMDAGVGASVVMALDLGPDGAVTAVTVVTSAGPAFDAAAVEAAKKLRFTPAEVDGKPAPVRIQFTSNFTVQQQLVEVPIVPGDAGVSVVNFSGLLKTAGTREPIAAASVVVGEQELTSNDQGRFEARDIPPGPVKVTVSAAGYETFLETEEVKAGERTEVTYVLRKASGNETIVRGVKDRREVAQVRLTQGEFKMIAGTNNDAFRVVQNLPGVARSPFGGSALVVRGSKAWDSRVYLDEIQIPQLFHFAGLTATFNSATLDSIAFAPGNFAADYGRSIGGLITAEVRTPSKTGLHGAVDVNVFDVSALVEAPVSENWSLSAAGRYGLAQLVLPFALKTFAPQSPVGFGLAPTYFDYQARLERRAGSSKDRLFIAVYGSSDRWSFLAPNPLLEPDIEGQGSAGSSVLYNRLVLGVDQRLSSRITFVSRNSVGFDASSQNSTVQEIFFRTTQVPVQLRERLRVDVPDAKLVLNGGLDALITPTVFDAQRPPVFRPNQLPDPYVTRRLIAETERSVYVEPGLFLDATWTPLDTLQVRGGLRFDGELAVMRRVWLNPRLSVRYSPIDVLTVKGGVAMYQQPPDYRGGQLSPVFGNPGLLPEGAWHFTVGLEARLFKLFELDVQGYYKAFFNQARLGLANGSGSDLSIPGAETRFNSEGYGRAYGSEVLLRVRPTKYFLGWVSYSLSRFERDYYGDVRFAPGPLDQPHNLIVVGSVVLPFNINLGARFRVASGPLVTPISTSIFDANGNQYVPIPALPWSQRLPTFVQLDVRVDKRFIFDDFSLTAYLDVQNATNQQNPEAQFYNFNYSQSAYVYGIPILPTLGLRGEW